jgi:peroxiredoxin
LASQSPALRARGAQVIAVTLGDPEETKQFCGARAPGLRCLSDPSQHAYRAFGIGQAGTAEIFAPSVMIAGAQAALQGHLPGQVVGDPLQLSGTFVVEKGGTIAFTYYSRTVADHADQRSLLTALDQIGWTDKA